jgi:hypothetical protein
MGQNPFKTHFLLGKNVVFHVFPFTSYNPHMLGESIDPFTSEIRKPRLVSPHLVTPTLAALKVRSWIM